MPAAMAVLLLRACYTPLCISISYRSSRSRFVWPLGGLGGDSVSLGWGWKIYPCDKFPGGAAAAGFEFTI